MSRRVFQKSLVFAGMTLSLAAGAATAQPPDRNKPAEDISDKARNVKPELKEAYKKWLSTDVAYIITKEEKRAFQALQTDEERENFIENFWRRRDPNPDTDENEYREEYYERIAYANEHFASGIPGHKTDRGRIYIKWGKPDSIESRPSGGSHDRPAWEGGGTTSTYPFEVWFYRHLEGVGEGIEIEFVDRTGTGEYRIARSPDEKDALAMVPRNSDPTRLSGHIYQRAQDTPFAKAQMISDLEKQPAIRFGDILDGLGSASGPVVDNNPLHCDVRVDMFRQSEERVVAVFTIQTNNRQMAFASVGGIETAKLNIIGRITAVSGKRAGVFEDAVTTTATADEITSQRERSSVYQKAVALLPGKYKIDVGIRDVSSGNKGISSIGFEVPRYDDLKLSTSTLIIASKLRPTDTEDIGNRFVIGNAKVIPNLEGRFKKGQEVGVYMQVYNAGVDQTTLRPAVDVDYVVVSNSKEVLRQREDWAGMSDSSQRLVLARLLRTDQFAAGEYELKVVVKDRVSGATVENKARFTIEK